MFILSIIAIQISLGFHADLHSSQNSKYLAKLSIGEQILMVQISLDTNLLMLLDVQAGSKVPSYNPEQSKTFQQVSPSSELCWSVLQVSSTSECSFTYKSSTNYTSEGALSLETVIIGPAAIKDFMFARIFDQSSELKVSGILGLGPSHLDFMYGNSVADSIISVITT
jgi:Xylanase inhibitor N-terminal